MADNEYLDPPSPQDISNLFVEKDLSSCSSSNSVKYKLAWLKAKVILFYTLSAEEFPDACSSTLSIAPNHKEIALVMVGDWRHFAKKYDNAISRHEQQKYCPMQHQLVIN